MRKCGDTILPTMAESSTTPTPGLVDEIFDGVRYGLAGRVIA